jgi:hypothetical protein
MPERKWTREVIQIDTDCGRVAMPARVLGPIAVHFGVGSHAKKISITHIRTGRRIVSTNAANDAQQIGEALAELNWDCLAGDSVPEGLRIEVVQILRRFRSALGV